MRITPLTSYNSLIPSIILHNAEGSFCLDQTVHPQQCSLDAFQICYDFSVHGCEFVIDPHRTIPLCLFALLCIWTSGTVFALTHFFLSAICVSFYHCRLILTQKKDPGLIFAPWSFFVFGLCFFHSPRQKRILSPPASAFSIVFTLHRRSVWRKSAASGYGRSDRSSPPPTPGRA